MDADAVTSRRDLRRGFWLGFAGVVIFSITLPVTRLAVGTPDAPELSGLFVAMSRAVIAAILAAVYLLIVRAPWPRREQWRALFVISIGVVIGFPVCTSVALQEVQAVHASAILGVLPLVTAMMAAVLHRQRPSVGFWVCAALGSALVVVYALLQSDAQHLGLQPGDLLLLMAVVSAALGYTWGARLSGQIAPEQVICWAVIVALPLTVPASLMTWPTHAISAKAWASLAYLAVFSMWIGFFFWYRGLALGGTVRVSQVQLFQPFLSMLFAVILVGERLDGLTLCFALAVLATVALGRKMNVSAPASAAQVQSTSSTQ